MKLTWTYDNRRRRRSCQCSERHSVQRCCCSLTLGRDSLDSHWSVWGKKNTWKPSTGIWDHSCPSQSGQVLEHDLRGRRWTSVSVRLFTWFNRVKRRLRSDRNERIPFGLRRLQEPSVFSDKPSGRSFQVSHLWCRSTGSQCPRCTCHNILDSGPGR